MAEASSEIVTGSCVAHQLGVKVRTGDIVASEQVKFASLHLSEPVYHGLTKCGFIFPSPIQLKAIPLGRCGLDLVVQAKSGTGKTIVFATIALESLITTSSAVQVLVLAPTREIAVQNWEVVSAVASDMTDVRPCVFIGGLPVADDRKKLKKCHIAVGTPGRIRQLIEEGMLVTSSIRLFVLDEADKLMEAGMQDTINWIYSQLSEHKQMLALSATYPPQLAEQLTLYMRSPTLVRLNIDDPALLGVGQYFSMVPYHPLSTKLFASKVTALLHILSHITFSQCLVFSNYQSQAQSLCERLKSEGWPVAVISGGLDQYSRLVALAKLKTHQCRILVSTDLTSRGIDAENVNLVVNLDLPTDVATYLHRIGRAGRYGSLGAAITLLSQFSEVERMKAFEGASGSVVYQLPDPLPANLTTVNCHDLAAHLTPIAATNHVEASQPSIDNQPITIASNGHSVNGISATYNGAGETVNGSSAGVDIQKCDLAENNQVCYNISCEQSDKETASLINIVQFSDVKHDAIVTKPDITLPTLPGLASADTVNTAALLQSYRQFSCGKSGVVTGEGERVKEESAAMERFASDVEGILPSMAQLFAYVRQQCISSSIEETQWTLSQLLDGTENHALVSAVGELMERGMASQPHSGAGPLLAAATDSNVSGLDGGAAGIDPTEADHGDRASRGTAIESRGRTEAAPSLAERSHSSATAVVEGSRAVRASDVVTEEESDGNSVLSSCYGRMSALDREKLDKGKLPFAPRAKVAHKVSSDSIGVGDSEDTEKRDPTLRSDVLLATMDGLGRYPRPAGFRPPSGDVYSLHSDLTSEDMELSERLTDFESGHRMSASAATDDTPPIANANATEARRSLKSLPKAAGLQNKSGLASIDVDGLRLGEEYIRRLQARDNCSSSSIDNDEQQQWEQRRVSVEMWRNNSATYDIDSSDTEDETSSGSSSDYELGDDLAAGTRYSTDDGHSVASNCRLPVVGQWLKSCEARYRHHWQRAEHYRAMYEAAYALDKMADIAHRQAQYIAYMAKWRPTQ